MNVTHGMVRIVAVSPEVSVANPIKNAEEHLNILRMLESVEQPDVVVFPELSLSGYTCADLFGQETLLEACDNALAEICNNAPQNTLIVVGLPVRVENSLYNCAAVINNGDILGIVPKTFIPTYREFYERRWFSCGELPFKNNLKFVEAAGRSTNFGTSQLFRCDKAVIGVEICEDLWGPIAPSALQALAGANILLNLSASNEVIGKAEFRRQLVASQSARCVAAYLYASSGPSESTADVVFGGHCLIAENGALVKESERVGDEKNMFGSRLSQWIVADIDVQQLMHDRRVTNSYGDSANSLKLNFHTNEFEVLFGSNKDCSHREINLMPFVPSSEAELSKRCAEVFGIQANGLATRMQQLLRDQHRPDVYIGVSGGLDSTLALLAAVQSFGMLGLSMRKIHGLTMPGFGTTAGTKSNAIDLMTAVGIDQETIDIRPACLQVFKSMKHKPFGIDIDTLDVDGLVEALSNMTDEQRAKGDLVFENVQARQRTMFLMSKGFVLGTGDLSEIYLGWCTYNGDHMSMYNVNASVPKTLMKSLIEYLIKQKIWDQSVRTVLNRIVNTEISPELLPPSKDGKIVQSTQGVLGPYVLHDFFMWAIVRHGFSPEKILYLLKGVKTRYSSELVRKTLITNVKRFFSQQFKRECVPNGPKVGTVSLSPRGDWRQAPDADPSIWLQQLEQH